MNKNYRSKYGSNKIFIKQLKKYVYFCKKCGEYITKTTGCSNPFCPEKGYNMLFVQKEINDNQN
jgi:hypothetical protein